MTGKIESGPKGFVSRAYVGYIHQEDLRGYGKVGGLPR